MGKTKLIWNPFKKGFWKKDNLMPPENRAELKEAWGEVKESARKDKDSENVPIGKKITRLGIGLTFAITIPLLAFLIAGFLGLFIGLIIGAAVVVSLLNK